MDAEISILQRTRQDEPFGSDASEVLTEPPAAS